MSVFGARPCRQRDRHYGTAPTLTVVSDGDEGLERVRERELFGDVRGNREGLDGYGQIPARWRRRLGRDGPVARAGSGAVEKNVEAQINRRFKRHARSWNPLRADRLMPLRWLQTGRVNWQHGWDRVCLSTTKVNPAGCQLTIDKHYHEQDSKHISVALGGAAR